MAEPFLEINVYNANELNGWTEPDGIDGVRLDNGIGILFACTGNCKGTDGK